MAVLVNVIDAAGIEGGRAANDAMDLRRGIYEIMMGAGGMTSDEVRCMPEKARMYTRISRCKQYQSVPSPCAPIGLTV